MTDTESPVYDPVERELMASMLENWFQQRISMSNKALRFILLPLACVILFAVAFWFNYYIPVPVIVLTALLTVSILVWIVFLFIGARLVKRVRTGDAIMLRKIRSSNSADEVDKT